MRSLCGAHSQTVVTSPLCTADCPLIDYFHQYWTRLVAHDCQGCEKWDSYAVPHWFEEVPLGDTDETQDYFLMKVRQEQDEDYFQRSVVEYLIHLFVPLMSPSC